MTKLKFIYNLLFRLLIKYGELLKMKFQHPPDKKLTRREVLKKSAYGGISLALPSFFLNGCGKKDDRTPKPNIIFILIDALRADRLGVYGYPGSISPVLDSIASESVVFERAIAQAPWTQPSVASLFCSYYPGAHKVTKFRHTLNVLSDSFVTLPEVLQQGGYSTAAFIANTFIKKRFGFAQGFEHFDASFADNTTPGSVVNKAFAAWINKRNTAKPFFAFLHYMDVHGPYYSREEFLSPLLEKVEADPAKHQLSQLEISRLGYLMKPPEGTECLKKHQELSVYREYWQARYDAGVREIDYHIDRLKNQLKQMRLWDNSYVIITSDHGESLAEHSQWDHGNTLYHPELHVPLMMRWPGVLKPGRRIKKLVRLIDIMPTLIEQINLPAVKGIQGRSLAGQLAGRQCRQNTITFAENDKLSLYKAVYLDDWKLIFRPKDNESALFRVWQDPLEKNELSAEQQDTRMQLLEIIHQQVALNTRIGNQITPEKAVLTPEEKKRLQGLGYVQ